MFILFKKYFYFLFLIFLIILLIIKIFEMIEIFAVQYLLFFFDIIEEKYFVFLNTGYASKLGNNNIVGIENHMSLVYALDASTKHVPISDIIKIYQPVLSLNTIDDGTIELLKNVKDLRFMHKDQLIIMKEHIVTVRGFTCDRYFIYCLDEDLKKDLIT